MAIAASCAFTQAKVVAAAAPDAKQKAREKQARAYFVCAFVRLCVSAGLLAPGQGQNLFNLLKNACDVLTYANSAKCSHLAAASFLRSAHY